MSENRMLTAEDVAERLGLTKQRVWELTRQKLIPSVTIGKRQYRYSAKAIDAWIEAGGSCEPQSLREAA